MSDGDRVIERWLTALQSGRYRESRRTYYRTLRTYSAEQYLHYTYTALGVLVDLAVQAGVVTWDEGVAFKLQDDAFPPQEVLDWARITWRDAKLIDALDQMSIRLTDDVLYDTEPFGELVRVLAEICYVERRGEPSC